MFKNGMFELNLTLRKTWPVIKKTGGIEIRSKFTFDILIKFVCQIPVYVFCVFRSLFRTAVDCSVVYRTCSFIEKSFGIYTTKNINLPFV